MDYQVTEPMVLAPDVIIISPREVAPEIRAKLDQCSEDDLIVTRPRSRSQSRVVNRDVAALLGLFQKPTTIVDATIAFANARQRDPQSALPEVFSTLRPFFLSRWLVPARSEEARRIESLVRPGDVVGGYRVVDCIRVLEDTDVYQVKSEDGSPAALKLIRRGASGTLIQVLQHEGKVLRHIDGDPAPRFLSEGRHEDMPYLVTSWCAGLPVTRAAAEIRQLHGGDARRPLLDLCVTVTGAFRRLHRKGVLQGDVYPANVLCDSNNAISILDYGFARLVDARHSARGRRCGVPEYYEPELARAMLNGATLPEYTPHAEQYAIAALLYLLAAGEPYLRFSAHKEGMLRQIAEDSPAAFIERGLGSWPKLESVLRRALDKRPENRFATLDEFEDALGGALPPAAEPPRRVRAARTHSLDGLVGAMAHGDPNAIELDPGLPHASVTYGAAGIAYGLYALACAREDPGLLAAADAWAVRAESSMEDSGAFASSAVNVSERQIGPASVYFGRPGIYLVQGLIAWAMGDQASFTAAVKRYLEACSVPEVSDDLTLGRAGMLLGCAILLDAISPCGHPAKSDSARLIAEFGRKAITSIWTPGPTGRDYLGIAHGLAGICYSALTWSEVSGEPLVEGVVQALDELGDRARQHGRGLRWPTRVRDASGGDAEFMESWCHGSPGYVYLWTRAYRVTGDGRYLQLAERAAWTAWEATDTIGSLCCGYAGRAYALLAFARHGGAAQWIDRAALLAERAEQACSGDKRTAHSLFKGALGVAVLQNDLDGPERATFPLFDAERRSLA